MSRSWDLDAGSTTSQSAEFTRFPVGTTRIRVLDDAPHIRWTHWMTQFGKSINCPGRMYCPIDDIVAKQRANSQRPSYNSSRRYAMNVYNYETSRVEIMEQGKTFMEDLKMIMEDLREDGKNLSDAVLRVRRTGTGKDDTKYRIDIQGDVTEDTPGEVIDLDEYLKPHTKEQITQLLAVPSDANKDDAWNEIMSGEKADEDEEFQLE